MQWQCISTRIALVETENHAKKILEHKEQFKDKPLKELLKEIKPQIKWAADTSMYPAHALLFNFVDRKQKDSLRSKNIVPMTIVVYVKEGFEWEYKKDRLWTSEDTEKYGNLIMMGSFRVYAAADIHKK